MAAQIRILLVDDSVPALYGFCHILGQAVGLEVIGQAQEGVHALELIQALLPNVVLVETRLPDICGMELAAEMRQRGLTARVLAVSADQDVETVRGMLESGAAGYLLKDEPPEKIIQAVRTVANGGTWFSQAIVAKLAVWTQQPPPALDELTAREVQVLELLKRGISNQEIAQGMAVAESTVRYHLRNLYAKLGVKRRGEAVAYALDQGIGAQRLSGTIAPRLSFPTGRTSRKR